MAIESTMPGILAERGWELYYTCPSCGGRRDYYSNKKYPGYTVRIRLKKDTFILAHNESTIAGPYHGYMLLEKLIEYEI